MDFDQITEEVKSRVSEKRFHHSVRTSEICAYIAQMTGYDEQKARIAGMLHDVARELSKDELSAIIEKYGVKVNRFERSFIPSIHGKVGAAIAEHDFGIEDKDILKAICNHVTGRPCMGAYELILYIADHLSKLEIVDATIFESYKTKTLEEVVYGLMKMVIEYDVKHGKMIDERTSQTFDWLIEMISKKYEHDRLELDVESLRAYDERMDYLIEFYRRHRVKIDSVFNIREAGEYPCLDGRTVRKHMIMRSGDLNRITPTDADRLKDLGINYVIDLRSGYEISIRPDNELPGIQNINISIEEKDAPKYSDKLMDWLDECDDPDETAWLTEHYLDSMDMDATYASILYGPKTIDNLHDVIEIMLREDCRGILIHCASGKDRTGIVMAFILELLGVEPDVIIDDYLASQVPCYGKVSDYICMSINSDYRLQTCRNIFSVMSVDDDRIEKSRKLLKDYNCTSDEIDISMFGLDPGDIKKLKEKYLK